ncbi:MAG: FtsQ-type POTRA domain-containing protein [Deltaproteobacteria bacterium]|nr:FtsQ-type POTRA domain-containing protein [Deltaproteobacteria bacterium]
MRGVLQRLLGRAPDSRSAHTGPRRHQQQRTATRRAGQTRSRTVRRVLRRERLLRLLVLASRPLLFVALAALTATIPVGLYRLLLHAMGSPHFALKEVRVQGLSHLTEEDVASAAGLRLGTSIMAYDPDEVEHALSREDWVRRVHVRRELPQTLVVDITERTPVAVLAAGDLFLVDDTATPFTRVSVREHPDLPVISLGSVESVRREDLRTLGLQEMLAEALALIAEYDRTGLGDDYPLEEISVDPVDGYRIYSRGGEVAFVLGKAPFVRKWGRLATILEDLDNRGAAPMTIRLDNELDPGRVAVQAAGLDLPGQDRRRFVPLEGMPRELLP